eukprot:CAMPEP_0195030316 /NCGR_PEP_ID=MMETSP0326_2-20130528/58643_1 /TAXON_ID=2866 ORGANISM="Crypthecodinium cohnii, Strain Seligo" /NCGR_SAMPLE_ID=MMETSP0326_2 /ASSEMBLY_ACC=CAM_ASM_000348 /LENGTH=44 /DNA_ID= /DNA_START= /DNA_END= /DNA_ORIENTATION=
MASSSKRSTQGHAQRSEAGTSGGKSPRATRLCGDDGARPAVWTF